MQTLTALTLLINKLRMCDTLHIKQLARNAIFAPIRIIKYYLTPTLRIY